MLLWFVMRVMAMVQLQNVRIGSIFESVERFLDVVTSACTVQGDPRCGYSKSSLKIMLARACSKSARRNFP